MEEWIADERKLSTDLTEREQEVLRLVARGGRDREIAEQLCIADSTARKHVQNILRKLGARNRVEAASHLHLERRRAAS